MKRNIPIILSVISSLGIALFMLIRFDKGTISILASYFTPLIGVVLLYIISILILLIRVITTGIKPNKINILVHATLWIFIGIMLLINSEAFKSERILFATKYRKLGRDELVLRKNGTCETNSYGIWGYEVTTRGEYTLSGDTITFIKIPSEDSNLITQKMLIAKDSNAIFMQNPDGRFNISKGFYTYFEINTINIP